MSVSEIIAQTEHKMKATVEHTREEFVKIRTGRASTGLLDQIKVDYYGCPTPLNQVAQVGVGDARTLTVQPWERTWSRSWKRRFAIPTSASTRPRRAT